MSEPLAGWRLPGTALTALAVAGCAVGPNFRAPAPPAGQAYYIPDKASSSIASESHGVHSTGLTLGADLPGQWWHVFKSARLDETLRISLINNPTLEQADATLAEAREQILVSEAAWLPKIGASAGVERSSGSAALPGTPETYSVGLSASYALDVFGGTRRAVEQSRAQAQMQRYQLAAAYLTLTGNVVQEALTIASTRLQIATTEELIGDDQKNLDLTQREFQLGAAAQTDVLTAESQLAVDQSSLPPLRQQLGAARDALAVLVGRAPADYSAPDFDIAQFTLPDPVPVSLPSRLVRQRPDVLAAEAQLHAASAAIGVAIAQEFPSLTLTASLSRDALTPGGLFHDFGELTDGGASLTAPIFEGGALRAQVRAARDAFAAQDASYRETVLAALQQVADDLRALDNNAAHVSVSQQALNISKQSLDLQRISYTAGKSTVLQLIDAERTYAQAKLTLATALIQQYQSIAGLFVALGGGWWKDQIAGSPAGP